MRRDVIFTSLHPAVPTFHRSGDWWNDLRRDGDEIVCNTIVYPDSSIPVGSNEGMALPERLVAPCGLVVAQRAPIIERRDSPGGTQVLNSTRMVVQGVEVPERHARLFGKPCARCFPIKEEP